MSFRFYDPIFMIVQENMTEDMKEFFLLKSVTSLEVYKKVDGLQQFLEKMGVRESQDQNNNEKLFVKHKAVNERDANFVNVIDTLHKNGVQRSDYIQVDTDLMYEIHKEPQKLKKMNQNILQRKLAPGEQNTDVP